MKNTITLAVGSLDDMSVEDAINDYSGFIQSNDLDGVQVFDDGDRIFLTLAYNDISAVKKFMADVSPELSDDEIDEFVEEALTA